MKKKELNSMTYAELVAKHSELNRKFMDLRFQMVVGHVENPLQKRTIRREIAQINTLIRKQELGGQASK